MNADGLGSLLDRYHRQILWAILCLALLLRVLALLSLKESIYFDFLLWDERVYHAWAEKIANGTFESSSVYEMAPLPAYLMALIYKVFSPDPLYIRIANIAFGVLTCYLIYLIGKEMADASVGLFACLVACLYEPFIFYSIVPLKTSLSVLLFSATIYLFMAVLRQRLPSRTLLLGMAIGLMLNVRPNCVVLIPVIPLLILWDIFKTRICLKTATTTLMLYIVGISAVTLPFIIRNYRVSGDIAVTASQSGFNLYIANNLENKDPYYRPVPFATTIPFQQGIQFNIEASCRAGERLSASEASAYWTAQVGKILIKAPGAFLKKILQKTLALFNRFEAGDHYHIGFISDFVAFFKFPFLVLGLILPFGLAGMALSLFKTRKSLFVSQLFFLYGMTLVVFFPTSRFRLPLLAILIPFGVQSIRNLVLDIKSRRLSKVLAYFIVAGGFFLVAILPIRGTDDMTAYYNTHAIILNSKGFKDEAIKYWEESSRMKKAYSAFANLSLAGKNLNKGNTQEAVRYLEKLSDQSFAAASKYALLGDVMLRRKKIKEAVRAYEKSLAINSGQRTVRAKLVKIFEKVDKKRARVEYAKLRYISSFYDML